MLILGVMVPAGVIGTLWGPFHVDKISPWTVPLLLAAGVLGCFWISFLIRCAQRFVQLRPLEKGEHAAFPLSEHKQAE
jgi:hypothetical protein